MKRFDGIKNVMMHIEDEIVICNIGFPSRELYQIKDRDSNFYMLGSMGLASSIGLGLAMSQNKKVIVFDGDGSILMNLGSLVTIFSQNPKNLILIVFDNCCYGSTGNQCTYTQNVDLLEIAKSIGFKNSYNYDNINFKDILSTKQEDSVFIHYKILPGNADSPIIDLTPEQIKNRFMNAIK
ncbi:3D-(3,5/4)-trihydroxycyclohexane-1,2-dione hydrolase [Methanobrevibacter cuticularis]|uniref:sulfopyruvate decarboxylase n=1 Tax=Methanobrevibacter cuticularis TaxID=47311 RepID=A0A166FHD2_9EURY|nr:sulfopyruvate decarboxylase subunit beta [Methanobrevibacter cuticularis]KZX17674.1 3D-(3,5/4)-trihydroxycyclohexane-1,2-dione hydrolase [Methanobrevibacter cuticularis]